MTSILFLIGTLFMQSIQMHLPKEKKTFPDLFSAFWEFRLNIKHFGKKDYSHSLYISEITDCERCG